MCRLEEQGLPRQSSAITILPNEVVAKIFTTGTEIWRDNHPYGLPFPILVSSVSNHWRQLARNTPNLWAFIIPPIHKDPDFCLLWTSEWLSRSGGLPLSVILDHRISGRIDRPIQETSPIISQTILLVVKSSKQRLYRLDISSIFDTGEIETALRLLDAPHLQQFSLCNWNTFSSRFSGGEAPRPWLINLPNVTKLRFQGAILPYIPRLTSLTAYNLHLTYSDVQAVFSTSPELAHLVLQNLIPVVGPIPLNRDLIQVNSLRSLALSANGLREPHGVYLFHLLTIPNLTYLEIDGSLQIFSVLGSSISSSKIETLRISNISTFSNQNIPDLKNYPPLTSRHHLQLLRAPTAGFLFRHEPQMGLSRRPSIDLRLSARPRFKPTFGRGVEATNHGSMPWAEPSKMPWPELHTITFDSLVASVVAELCRFVQLHKGVQRVEVSRTVMRHLSGSLRRDGDRIYHLLKTPIIKGKEGTKDVPEWLGALVELRVFDPQAYGLLDDGRFPFHEMP